MLWLLSDPPGFTCTCWLSFAPVFNLCTVESLSFCISFLYLDFYVFGDDALINKGLSCKPNIYTYVS